MATSQGIRAGRAYVELGVSDKLNRGLKSAQRKLQNFSASVSMVGRGLAVVGGSITAPVIAGAKVYADFEKQMAMVSTMLDEPAKYMQEFSKGIKAMSLEFGQDTGTMSKGLYDLLSASVAPAEAMRVLRTAMVAARAGITDAATSVSTLANIMNAYHIPASRINEISDTLFMTVRRGVTTFGELAQYIGSVTATANAAGMSLDDMGAYLATATRNGLKTDLAVTALSNMLIAFIKPSDKGAAMAKKLGFELSVAGLKAEGFASIMNKLSKADPAQLAAIFKNARGLRGVLAVRGDITGFNKDVELMGQKAGATATAYSKFSGMLSTFFNRIGQLGKQLLGVLGEIATPDIKTFGERLITIGVAAIKWAENNKELLQTIIRIASIVTVAGVALLGLGVAFKIAAFGVGMLSAMVSIATPLLGFMMAPLAGIAGMLTGLGGIIGAVLSPVILLKVAFAALIVTIMSMTGQLDAITNYLKTTFAGVVEIVTTSFSAITNAIKSGDLSLAFKVFTSAAYVIWRQFIYDLMNAWDSWRSGFLSAVGSSSLPLRNLWIGLAGGFISAWITVKMWFLNFWEWLKAGFLEFKLWAAQKLGEISDVQYRHQVREIEKIKTINQRNITAESMDELAKNEAEIKRKQGLSKEDYLKEVAEGSSNFMKPYQDALNNAKDEWKNAVDEANFELPKSKLPDNIQNAVDKIKAAEPTMNRAAEKSPIAGTFFVQAAKALGAGTVAERTAKASEETADNTAEIKDRLDDLEMNFT